MRIRAVQCQNLLLRPLPNAKSKVQNAMLGFAQCPRAGVSHLDLFPRCARSSPVDDILQLLHEDKGQDSVRPNAKVSSQRDTEAWQAHRDTGTGCTHVSRNHAGVHPFIKNRGPSFVRPRDRTWSSEAPPALEAAWILLLSTSAGAQIVVATVPAISEASICVRTSSPRLVLRNRNSLAAAYLLAPRQLSTHHTSLSGIPKKTHGAIWPTFINTLRTTVAPSPLPNAAGPSSRAIRARPRNASG